MSRLIEWFLYAGRGIIFDCQSTLYLWNLNTGGPLQFHFLNFASSAHRMWFPTWFSQIHLIRNLDEVWKICFLLMQSLKTVMMNDPTPRNFMTRKLMLHGRQNPWFQNFAICSTWLSHPTTSKYWYPCYDVFTQQFQNFIKPIILLFGGLVETVPNMIAIVTITAVLVPHNVIFFGFVMPMNHGVNKKTPPSSSCRLPPPTRVSPALFVVL